MDPRSAPTICLSMIVRDEAHVLRRCLDSVKPYIDHWIICDTGSTDDTVAVARDTLHDIPGAIHHHKWKDFGHNRSLALALAAQTGCDYILVIDADEWLVVEDPLVLATLTEDAYRVEMRFPAISYPRVNLMRAALDWRYVGVIHEYATCTPPAAEYLLTGLHMETDGQGARGRSPDKAVRDLAVMQQSVIDEPNNPRYWFYLAQGYEVAGRLDDAILAYTKRAAMHDYYEEVWYSHYRIAHLSVLKSEWDQAVVHYLRAFEVDPTRAEPLYWLAIGYHNRTQDRAALMFLEAVCLMQEPVSALFVEPAVYQILRWIHYAVCMYNLGQKDDAVIMANKCMASGKVPPQYIPALERILKPYANQLATPATALGE